MMRSPTFFVTGTDTGVGKTVAACLLVAYLRRAGLKCAALKPICSGGREDARLLRQAAGSVLDLDEVNPWTYRAALAPSLAARRENKTLALREVIKHLSALRKRFPVLVVEGAGGLLSPLGSGFDSRDLMVALRAVPIVACSNRLGAINQILLVMEALPPAFSKRARIVLTPHPVRDPSQKSNAVVLENILGPGRVFVLPKVNLAVGPGRALASRSLVRVLSGLIQGNGGSG